MNSQIKAKRRTANHSNIITSIIFGIITGFAVILILTIILSAISLKFRNPIDFVESITFFCLIISGLSCGIVASAVYKPNWILSSGISSGIMSLILLITAINSNHESIVSAIINPIIILIFGISGGFIVHLRNSKRKTRKYFK